MLDRSLGSGRSLSLGSRWLQSLVPAQIRKQQTGSLDARSSSTMDGNVSTVHIVLSVAYSINPAPGKDTAITAGCIWRNTDWPFMTIFKKNISQTAAKNLHLTIRAATVNLLDYNKVGALIV